MHTGADYCPGLYMGRGLTGRPCRHGLAIVYLALIISVLLGVMGLAADTSYVFWTAHQLQNAADAAALAGAAEVGFSTSQAVTNAVNAAAVNKAAGAAVQLNSSTDVQVGNYVRSTATFIANTSPYNAVKVTACRTTGSPAGPINLVFGPMFGVTSSNVSRSSIAMSSSTTSAGIILLNPNAAGALTMSGSGTITVNNGGMVVNSTSSSAIVWSGSPTIVAKSLCLSGNDTAVNTGCLFSGGVALLNQTPLADPLASLAPPAKPAVAASGNPLPPGYYANGLPAGTLAGGVYWVDNGIVLSGSAGIDARAGCLIYIHSGGIVLSGSCTLKYAPMTTGTYAGIAFYQDRGNSSAVALSGATGVTNAGVLYFPQSTITISGSPTSIGTQLICNKIVTSGSSNIVVNYSSNSSGHSAFLVQ